MAKEKITTYRICSKCRIEPVYYKSHAWCYKCESKAQKNKYRANPEFYKEKSKMHYYKNREKCLETAREWKRRNKENLQVYDKMKRLENPDKIKKWGKLWREKNKEKILEDNRNYRKLNIEKVRENKRKYEKKIKLENPSYKILANMRTRISSLIKKGEKRSKTLILLGCSLIEFKEYLQKKFTSKMTWDNYGKYWHVDHIIPCAKFNLSDAEQQKQCFHYRNLQPLEASENLRKNSRIETPLQISLTI